MKKKKKKKKFLLLKRCVRSTETVGLLGAGAQDGHLDFRTAPELWEEEVEEEEEEDEEEEEEEEEEQ